MAAGVINASSRNDAIQSCKQFLAYYPFRYAAIVEFNNGTWGWCSGKTKARMNRLAREGYNVYMASKS